MGTKWEKRYCVLLPNQLLIYLKANDKRPEAVVALTGNKAAQIIFFLCYFNRVVIVVGILSYFVCFFSQDGCLFENMFRPGVVPHKELRLPLVLTSIYKETSTEYKFGLPVSEQQAHEEWSIALKFAINQFSSLRAVSREGSLMEGYCWKQGDGVSI